MKQILLFCLLILCSSNLIANEQEQFERLIEELTVSKLKIDEQAEVIKESLKQDRKFSAKLIDDINKEAAKRMKTREETLSFIDKYRYLVMNKPQYVIEISPEEILGFNRALALALTLYEVTTYSYLTYSNDRKLRKILNEKDSSYEKERNYFKRSIKGVHSFQNRRHLKRSVILFQRFYLTNDQLREQEEFQVAENIILNTFIYHKISRFSYKTSVIDFFKITGSKIRIAYKSQIDFLNFIGNSILYRGSKLFGNFMGRFQSRHGKLYQNSEFIVRVKRNLKPMDILLEKTPFRLTDRFIPGYWGHAAIYIGNQRDLKKLGIWDHPLVQKYADDILAGKSIVEALRDKVQINTLESFSDIDDFALLRLNESLTDQELAEHIIRALSHIGKLYDFSFDVDTGDRIVCSELHFRTFINIPFNTTPILGRNTISVDQVAEQGVSGGPFSPVLVYIDGVRIEENLNFAFDATLLKSLEEQDILAWDDSDDLEEMLELAI
jgi:hypothetical protein